MNLVKRVQDGVLVIGLAEPAEIDVGRAEPFKTGVLEAIGDASKVVLDASNVEFFDSSGMGALLTLKKRMSERQGTMVLAGLNRNVTQMFNMVGFDVVFSTFPDTDAAIGFVTSGG